MGAWGSGAFENDDAMDWTYGLTADADEGPVRRALMRASGAPPDAVVASSAVAAAEVVAAGLGRPGPDLPGDVSVWVADRRGLGWAALVPDALAALERVATDSELAELWGEEDDGEWRASLDELRVRLAP